MKERGDRHPAPTTALARRPVDHGALARTTLARAGAPRHDGVDPFVLSWSLVGLDRFSLTPTILQALNRVRVLSGLEPLQMQPDGTIDLQGDPLEFSLADSSPFAR